MSLFFYTALFFLLQTVVADSVVNITIGLNVTNCPSYGLRDDIRGRDFFSKFRWESFDDPTHGRVNYLDQEAAIQAGLSYAVGQKFYMRADSTQNVTSGRGRDSVRISSYATVDEGVVVLDLEHMPTGCGTWPAFWSYSQAGPWPQGGEIDIIEGVNNDKTNLASLHTSPNCQVPTVRDQTGTTMSTNCDAAFNYNQGCGTRFRSTASWGKPFNDNGGGWFVLQKSSKVGIKVWFWPRSSYDVPHEIRHRASYIQPSDRWGTPDAYFPLDWCNYEDHFDPHMIIFNITFCGDWAGNDWPTSSCGIEHNQTCASFVDNNPAAFSEAYWEINSLRVYVP